MTGEKDQRAAEIDWAVVRQRLDAARAATERAWNPDVQTTARILAERARTLAQTGREPHEAEALEVVEFMVSNEMYGIETSFIREIHPLTNLTPVPCTPAFVLGVFNLRGEIVSVMDIKRFFDLPESGLTDLNKVVVLQSASMRFGVLADAIQGVRRMAIADIQPSLPTLTGIRQQYLKGVTSERTIILDAERLLADENIVVREQV